MWVGAAVLAVGALVALLVPGRNAGAAVEELPERAAVAELAAAEPPMRAAARSLAARL